jgi:hypothetical protein
MWAKMFHPKLPGRSNQRGFASRMDHRLSTSTLPRVLVVGSIGGLLGALAMALFGVGIFLMMGMPASQACSIIGDAVAGMFYAVGIDVTGGVSLGTVAYCLISLALGILFAAGVSQIEALRVDSTKKGVGLGILCVEIMSQPMLAAAAIILKMTASMTAQWFGVSFVMHLVYGAILGAVVSYGLRAAAATR